MFLFWDNSNIHFVGLNNVFPVKEPGIERELFRTHFKNLFELGRNGRVAKKAFMAGSVPPKDDSLWKHIISIGMELTLLERTAGNKEAGIDETIQNYLLRTIIDEEPSTIALLTGDGSGKALGKGFLADLERAKKLGWNIEVYSWDAGCNRYLREFAQKNGKFIKLEDYYDKVTFIKNGRRAQSP